MKKLLCFVLVLTLALPLLFSCKEAYKPEPDLYDSNKTPEGGYQEVSNEKLKELFFENFTGVWGTDSDYKKDADGKATFSTVKIADGAICFSWAGKPEGKPVAIDTMFVAANTYTFTTVESDTEYTFILQPDGTPKSFSFKDKNSTWYYMGTAPDASVFENIKSSMAQEFFKAFNGVWGTNAHATKDKDGKISFSYVTVKDGTICFSLMGEEAKAPETVKDVKKIGDTYVYNTLENTELITISLVDMYNHKALLLESEGTYWFYMGDKPDASVLQKIADEGLFYFEDAK